MERIWTGDEHLDSETHDIGCKKPANAHLPIKKYIKYYIKYNMNKEQPTSYLGQTNVKKQR